jgi:hypothetical protein
VEIGIAMLVFITIMCVLMVALGAVMVGMTVLAILDWILK